VTPLASLQYIYLAQGGFTETGVGANLHVSRADLNSLRSRLLLQFSRPFAWRSLNVVPSAYFGGAQEYLADGSLRATFASTSTSFVTEPGSVPRSSGIVGGQLQFFRGQQVQFNVRYQGEFFGNSAVHLAEANFWLAF
jgi:uncharacterized protein with beta-barrel porin domain